eukprot:gene9384-11047_t
MAEQPAYLAGELEQHDMSSLFWQDLEKFFHCCRRTSGQCVVLNPAVKHIVDNLNIFGFGSEESALLQSVKELLENSLDACRSSTSLSNPTNKHISVSIKEIDAMTCALEVSDDGSGVSDALSILKVFCSSKDGSNSRDSNPFATGRFGVGLSTCLVYSLDKCGTAMRMVTKCKEQDSATIADYSMDRTGQPQCVQNRSVNTEDLVSGTKIRVVLPLCSDRVATVKKVCLTMGMYLVLLDCLPQSHFQIDLQASVNGYNYSLQTSGHIPTPYATSSVATVSNDTSGTYTAGTMDDTSAPSTQHVTINTNTEETTTEVTHTIYAQRYAKYLAGTNQRIHRSATAEVKDSNEEVTVVVELILTEAEASTLSTTNTNTADTSIPVTLHRYVNHTPLLDYQQDALSCGILMASLRTVKWAQYGYKLKNNSDSGSSDRGSSGSNMVMLQTGCEESMQDVSRRGLASSSYSASNTDTSHPIDAADTTASTTIPALINNSNNASNNQNHTLWHNPGYELVCTRPELCDSIQTKNIHLVLAVDVTCSKVPYANMRKTSLSGDCPGIQALITQGVNSVLSSLEHADDAPGLFVTRRDYKVRLMLQRYLPSIANSVATMVMLCKEEGYLERVQELLYLALTTASTEDSDYNNNNNINININSDGSDPRVSSNNRSKAALAEGILQKLRDMLLQR